VPDGSPLIVSDAVAAYRGLLDRGVGPGRVAVVGESAGAGLAVAMLVALQAEGARLPSCAVLFSPYADLTLSGESMSGKAGVDPAFRPEAFPARARDYVGTANAGDGLVSPVFADLTGLPPLLVQVGTHEVLLDDAVRLAGRAAADNVAANLEVTPGVPHLFQAFAAVLEEGDAALSSVARFLHAHLRTEVSA
jgi:acetyl esterase/lipase